MNEMSEGKGQDTQVNRKTETILQTDGRGNEVVQLHHLSRSFERPSAIIDDQLVDVMMWQCPNCGNNIDYVGYDPQGLCDKPLRKQCEECYLEMEIHGHLVQLIGFNDPPDKTGPGEEAGDELDDVEMAARTMLDAWKRGLVTKAQIAKIMGGKVKDHNIIIPLEK